MNIRKVSPKRATATRQRWTILDVEEHAITLVAKYARKSGQNTGAALSEIITKALEG